jgi:hypothetical protein
MKPKKITLPVLQIWAPKPGFVEGTAVMVRNACARKQRGEMERLIQDRKSNGQAFEGERVVRRHALVELIGNEVTLVLMECETRPR